MKHSLFAREIRLTRNLLILCVFLFAAQIQSCKNQNEPEGTKKVAFHVQGLTVSSSSLAPARKSNETPTEANLTDLWLFEGTTLLSHQTKTDANFGSPELELTFGNHAITIIGSGTTNQTFTNGVWSGNDPRDCFGCVHNVNVTSTTGEQAVVLTRCYYALQWQSEDNVPTNAKTVEVTVGNYRKTLLAGLNGGEIADKTINASVTSYIGKTLTVSAYGFTELYGTEEMVHTTYTIKDAGGNVIVHHEKDVPVLSNRATVIVGNIFGGASQAAVRVNIEPLERYEISL